MPLMAAHSRSDARGTARLLATMALDCIDNPSTAPAMEVELNNVYRLLESYRKNAFFGREAPPARPTRTPAGRLKFRPPVERHVKEVRDALEHATAIVFAGEPKEQALQTIEAVLRAVAYPKLRGAEKPSPIDRERAAHFFREFMRHL